MIEQVARGELSCAAYLRAQLELPLSAATARAEPQELFGMRASEPRIYASVSYGHTRVLAVMLHKLPMAVWLRLSSGNWLRQFQAQLLGDDAFQRRVKAQLDPQGAVSCRRRQRSFSSLGSRVLRERS